MRDGREQLELMNLLAHDLKNPIGAALANLGFAEGAETTDPELPGALRDATTAVKRVLQIVDNMTVASQHQAGELTVAKDPVVLRDVLEALVSAPAEDRTTVVVACPPDLCASADAELLRRALEALLEASTRWVGSRGKLLLGARKDGERVLVFVAHDLPFEREPRLAALASDGAAARPCAIGLALYFARCVAEAHGGTLAVRKTPEWATEIALELPS